MRVFFSNRTRNHAITYVYLTCNILMKTYLSSQKEKMTMISPRTVFDRLEGTLLCWHYFLVMTVSSTNCSSVQIFHELSLDAYWNLLYFPVTQTAAPTKWRDKVSYLHVRQICKSQEVVGLWNSSKTHLISLRELSDRKKKQLKDKVVSTLNFFVYLNWVVCIIFVFDMNISKWLWHSKCL